MKKYLGVKLIQAEEMNVVEYNKQFDRDVPEDKGDGYTVVYEEGYRSWSPKSAFEKAYRSIDGLTFGLAIEAMKLGKCVTRKGWHNSEIWIEIQNSDKNSEMTESYIFMRKYDMKFPVEVSCESMLAEDWIII